MKVGRTGISAAYGTPASVIERALERRASYFYSAVLTGGIMAGSVRRLVKKNREKMVVVIQNCWLWAMPVPMNLKRGLEELRAGRADISLCSTLKRRPNQRAVDAALKLKDKGLIHHLGLTCHRRPRFAQVKKEKIFEVFHVRYNGVHRRAEKDLFPLISDENGPGIVIFTATCHTKFLRRSYVSKSEKTPRAIDCYRFVLSNPSVHVFTTGAQYLQQAQHALKALELRRMSGSELAWMRRVGDHMYFKK